MTQLFNNKTGVVEDVNPDDIPQLVASGTHSMEADQKLQFVGPDGKMFSGNSNNAANAFAAGYRLPTVHDQEAFYDRKNDKIKEEHFGSAGMAFGLGAARGATFGLSDTALAAGGLGDETKEVKERSPWASGAGEIAGMVGSSALLPGGGFVGAGENIAKAGTAVAEAALPQAATRAGQIVSKLSSKALGSSLEGAYYGVGQTISEQALGNPESVVDNLAANVGYGALFGGVIGGGFGAAQEARPFLEGVARKTYNSAAEAAQALSQRMGGSLAERAVLARTGDAELAASARKMANPSVYEATKEAAEIDAKSAAQNLKDTSELNKQSQRIATSLKDELKNAPESVRQAAATALKLDDNDIAKASQRLYQDVRQGDQVLEQQLNTVLNKQEPVLGDLKGTVSSVVDSLRATGNTLDQQLASELRNISAARINGIQTAADEVRAAIALKEHISAADIGSLSKDGRKAIIEELRPYLKESLSKYSDPVVSTYMTHIDDKYAAIQAMMKATSAETKVSKLFLDPAKQEKLASVFSKVADLAPEFKAFQQASKDLAAQTKVAEDAYIKYRQLSQQRGLEGSKMSFQDFKQIFSEVAGPGKQTVDRALHKMGEIQTAVQTQGLSNIDAAIQLKRALGQPVDDLVKYQPMSKSVEALNAVRALRSGDEANLNPMRVALGVVTGGKSEIARTAMSIYADPERVYKALTTIEKASNKGAQILDQATQMAAKALTGQKTEKLAFLSSVGTSNSKQTQKDRVASFNNIISRLSDAVTNPSVVMDHMNRASAGVEGIPGIKTAMTQKFMVGVEYLHANAPKDPLAGKTFFSNGGNYQPSDYEMAIFKNRYDVVHNPLVAIKAIGQGTVSPEQIDALKNVYPAIYQNLQKATISAIMEHGKDIPYQKKLVASQIFGMPADYTMTPEFVQAMQQNMLPADQGGRPDGAQDANPRKSKLDIKPFETVQTATGSISNKQDA